ncbi:non-canonical purine NTP pyrophosphatase, rdgB/HAM1 family [Aspergillus japonicus CBS 114.51]|uniref:Inosine triphosphate pyrophosphatase n=1 Tax=Aspergillus japonicus CBS 114.51 TaxID=1448312 RepID=A0A8T8X2W8_ASPJA|nr:non-canonical purine NTP pyrophosphatase, rdgB/HAM1 family [Aspergillus japonicus CBS 114.51]RAH82463.1 non-canonical purine NTP pyrophosphatase, rdgB/HAM1 family [Aspergillus japonicus CBS 114.51]
MLTLTLVSGNRHKISELNAILGSSAILNSIDLDLPEIQGSVEEITREKCRVAAEKISGPVLVEDSALEMHALNRMPGPYVKAFVDSVGNEGLYKMVAAFEDKTAEAVCTIGYSSGPGAEPILFQGRLLGKIVPPRGISSFGWEPIFEHGEETLAEMDVEKKNGLSHRFHAAQKLSEWLKQNKRTL